MGFRGLDRIRVALAVRTADGIRPRFDRVYTPVSRFHLRETRGAGSLPGHGYQRGRSVPASSWSTSGIEPGLSWNCHAA